MISNKKNKNVCYRIKNKILIVCGDVGQGRKPHFCPGTKTVYPSLLFSSNLIMLVNCYFYFVINKKNRHQLFATPLQKNCVDWSRTKTNSIIQQKVSYGSTSQERYSPTCSRCTRKIGLIEFKEGNDILTYLRKKHFNYQYLFIFGFAKINKLLYLQPPFYIAPFFLLFWYLFVFSKILKIKHYRLICRIIVF
jgi:hypothetical protein